MEADSTVTQTQVPHGWGAAAQRQKARDKDSTARTKDKEQGQSQQQATVVGAPSSARGCGRWSLISRTRRFLSRAVANRLSATGGRIAAGRGAAMDWMFVEGRDADAHEMVFGDRYQEERPAVGGGASTCTLRLDWRRSGHSNSIQCYLKLLAGGQAGSWRCCHSAGAAMDSAGAGAPGVKGPVRRFSLYGRIPDSAVRAPLAVTSAA
ncbi:uncharacterized protein Triagg1_6516 [Trichoderma aggressivum f. europaeum]|uniref:Uncharacterized protein n=1 Tax=Trichoderma aggressivum f. europaeum TaxID=173218 RepID=A0AAE1ICM9_9HYPO|nr:hypothetical protein Triagg1_6516 [Trichoderma aggressivum f. europaeum]